MAHATRHGERLASLSFTREKSSIVRGGVRSPLTMLRGET